MEWYVAGNFGNSFAGIGDVPSIDSKPLVETIRRAATNRGKTQNGTGTEPKTPTEPYVRPTFTWLI